MGRIRSSILSRRRLRVSTPRFTPVAGSPEFPVLAEQRTYSIAASVETQDVVVSGGIQFVDTLPGLGAGEREQPRPVHPRRGPRHGVVSGLGLLRDRGRSSTPSRCTRTCRRPRCGATCSSRRAASGRPGPARRRTPINLPMERSDRGRPSPLPRARRSPRGRTGPCGSSSATCCRPARAEPLPPGRHDGDGFRHGADDGHG